MRDQARLLPLGGWRARQVSMPVPAAAAFRTINGASAACVDRRGGGLGRLTAIGAGGRGEVSEKGAARAPFSCQRTARIFERVVG